MAQHFLILLYSETMLSEERRRQEDTRFVKQITSKAIGWRNLRQAPGHNATAMLIARLPPARQCSR